MSEVKLPSGKRPKAWPAEDFAKAVDVLSRDLCSAGDHFSLWKELNKARRSKTFALAFNQSNTFWYLTFRAHLENTISGCVAFTIRISTASHCARCCCE
jgi:hypothetical protein